MVSRPRSRPSRPARCPRPSWSRPRWRASPRSTRSSTRSPPCSPTRRGPRRAARDEAQQRGEALGPLHGVPVAIKEENDVAGTVTTFGGSANRTPALRDGHVDPAAPRGRSGRRRQDEHAGVRPLPVHRVRRATATPATRGSPATRPGGSSGGTAAAVAAGMVAVGIGGDGGGSIRIPSACCGLFGLKPTRGRVSSRPHPDLWTALGTVGPLTRSVLDTALVYDVIRGNEPTDRCDGTRPGDVVRRGGAAGCGRRPSASCASAGPPSPPIPGDDAGAGARRARSRRRPRCSRGWGTRSSRSTRATPTRPLRSCRSSFGGVRDEAEHRRGPRAGSSADQAGCWRWERGRGPAWSTRAVAPGREARGDGRRADLRPLRRAAHPDAGRAPTADRGAGRASPLPIALLRALPMIAYTALWNVTGHPAAAVPSGFADDGLPTSVQLVGPRGDEATLFALSAQVESVRPWADRRPELGCEVPAGAAGRTPGRLRRRCRCPAAGSRRRWPAAPGAGHRRLVRHRRGDGDARSPPGRPGAARGAPGGRARAGRGQRSVAGGGGARAYACDLTDDDRREGLVALGARRARRRRHASSTTPAGRSAARWSAVVRPHARLRADAWRSTTSRRSG